MFLGTFLVCAMSVVWVLGAARWEETDPQDPRKVFVQEVSGTLKARIPWIHTNGASPNGAGAAAAEARRQEEEFGRDSDLKDK